MLWSGIGNKALTLYVLRLLLLKLKWEVSTEKLIKASKNGLKITFKKQSS